MVQDPTDLQNELGEKRIGNNNTSVHEANPSEHDRRRETDGAIQSSNEHHGHCCHGFLAVFGVHGCAHLHVFATANGGHNASHRHSVNNQNHESRKRVVLNAHAEEEEQVTNRVAGRR